MEHQHTHVCGGLPVSQVMVIVTRCHFHEAYTLSVELRRQEDEDPKVLLHEVVEYGPFDSFEEIVRRVCGVTTVHVDALMALR